MLAAVTRSPGNLVLDNIPAPATPAAGRVIVRPEVVGICGSDLHLFSGDVGSLSGVPEFYPRIQGHEVSAVVERAGAGCPPELSPGTRVAVLPLTSCGRCYPCRSGRPNVCARLRLVGVHIDGGLQEYLDVAADAAFPVGGLDAGRAAFVEPMSIAVHALRRAGPITGERAVIVGAGPIGLATVIAAGDAGAETMVIDPEVTRQNLAMAAGASRAVWGEPAGLLEAVREWTGGEGAPLVIEASGEPSVLAQALEMACPAGRVVVVGMSAGTAEVRPGVLPEKEIDVLGSSCASGADFAEAIRLVTAHAGLVGSLLTHRFPLRRAAEAFDLAMKRQPGAVKILVTIDSAS
ncbi:MAG: alcohol dehydrogenase catalytic domain-containing protein [Streptosporangiaceae bacterium]|nr:alcohol dehydrogenase catalytic domain-containing protein [Streptosporangiaceae bacterium]